MNFLNFYRGHAGKTLRTTDPSTFPHILMKWVSNVNVGDPAAVVFHAKVQQDNKLVHTV